MATKNRYEFTYIINPILNEQQIKDLVQKVNKLVEEYEGTILEVEEWGSRRLAFPINKKRNGYYVNMYFDAPGDIVLRLERAMVIEDNILRYLTLRMDKKMLRHYEQRQQKATATAAAESTADA